MHRVFHFSLVAVAAAGLYGMSLAPARAECTTVGSAGDGINEGVAKFMAEHGLQNILEAKGLKPQGPITYKCEAGMLLTECHARQQGCK
jgi:hypothetical protein